MTTIFAIGLLIGLGAGAIITYLICRRTAGDMEHMSAKAMQQQIQSVLELTESKLAGKKEVIDGTLQSVKQDLKRVEELMHQIGTGNAKLDTRLEGAAKVIKELSEKTGSLQTALSSNSGRGQWGERMAEDVLRLSGLIEGINYIKQKKLETGSKPDFTFLLPQNLKLNMDVKFPFNNYQLYMEATGEREREELKKEFMKDVRKRLKEVQTRDYINTEDSTVDYVLLFIPNEQIFSFINEMDRTLIDDALKGRTILCSPMSLYAVLGVIRQSIDNFNLQSKSKEMLSLFGSFKQQWEKFKEQMETVKDRFESVHKGYEELTSTRERQLDRQFTKIEELRSEQGIALPAPEEIFEEVAVKNSTRRITSINK